MQNKTEILAALQERFGQITNLLKQADSEEFYRPKGEKWSSAEIVQHLALTNASVASILKADKQVWIDRFGKPDHSSRSSSEMDTLFKKTFNTPRLAPSRYVPSLKDEDTPDAISANWNMVLSKFVERIKNWTEEDLDACGVPHPALGMLTAREHLFFAIFHTDHHIRQIIG